MKTAYQVVHEYEDGEDPSAPWPGCATWLNLADELSDPRMTLDDFDSDAIAAADAWAATMGLPAVGQIVDVDFAYQAAAEAIEKSAIAN